MRFGQVYNSMESEYCQGRTSTAQERLVYNRNLQQAWRRGWAVVGEALQAGKSGCHNPDQPRRCGCDGAPAAGRQPRLATVGAARSRPGRRPLVRGQHNRERGSECSGCTHPDSRAPPPLLALHGTTAIAGFITVGQRTPTTLSPDNLKIGNRSFVVYQASVDKDRNWLVSANPNYASWLVGAVVNWTFALMLQTDPDANAMLTQLRAAVHRWS